MRPVPSVPCPADNQLLQTLRGFHEPRVMRGLVAHWPVVKAATQSNQALVNYLSQFDKGMVVDCLHLAAKHQGRMFYNEQMNGFNFTRQRQPFMAALNMLLERQDSPDADSLYVGSTSIDSCLPGFTHENPIPLDEAEPLATLWIGNKSRIAAHYDAPDNLICVTAGRRKVTLFPPAEVENLYVGPLHFTPAGQAVSLVDFHAPDYDKFPRFKEALDNAFTVELEPGDALLIPSMWWHHIEGQQSLNMLVNFWWRDAPSHLGRAENALYHALLSLSQLPDKERQAWQSMFDFYVFGQDSQRFEHIPEAMKGPLGEQSETTQRQFRAWLANHLKQ
ncbi:cupin-like domain-containing protein [Salinimonas chungwhensis]|uniref:cupin-like domain-containing protein n=1 Tax=Salinimonas chungwhensis TaxID=265425 RepID=UPI000377A6A8|nr:cupin-like domain-containing protein [Salinimonas chungwhensis]